MIVGDSLSLSFERNDGMPLDREWVEQTVVNRSAVERRAATLPGRRTVKKAHQAAWLIRAIQCMDLTTLSGDDTPGNVHRLCAKAKMPLAPPLKTRPLRLNRICARVSMLPAMKAEAPAGVRAGPRARRGPHRDTPRPRCPCILLNN